MANAFGIIAALLLAGAAFFGFKNKQALADQRRVLDSEQQRLDVNNGTFEEKKTELADLQGATKDANDTNAELSEKLEAQLSTNKTLQSDIDDNKGAAESKKAQVEEGNEKLSAFGELEDLKRNLEKLGTDLATLEGELLLRDTEIKSRSSVSKATRMESEALDNVLRNYATKKSQPDLKASVSRVVKDLGFVILSGGDEAGIIRDSILEVKRGGETIGKLKVTATEPRSASASMIPDSFSDGMTVRIGDQVVAAN